jgi:hypothetical protein
MGIFLNGKKAFPRNLVRWKGPERKRAFWPKNPRKDEKNNPVKWPYYKVWQGYLNEATAAPTSTQMRDRVSDQAPPGSGQGISFFRKTAFLTSKNSL